MDLNPAAIRYAAESTLAYAARIASLEPKKLEPDPRAPGMAPQDRRAVARDAVYSLTLIGPMLDKGQVAQAFYKLVAAQTALWCTQVLSSDTIEQFNLDAIEMSKQPA
ncbi:MAG: hypothetical protein KBD06_02065 [Candidatus Pacebacteria bacterium]|nr:hypothetical protein [Candidatus Paceibacterota bacterium]